MKSFLRSCKENPALTLLGAAVVALVVPAASAATPTPQSIAGVASAGPRLVPFVVEIAGGLADSGGSGTSNPEILVDSDGDDGCLILNSILVRSNVPSTGYQAFRVNSVTLNGTKYDTRTVDLIGLTDGPGVLESADLMGTPVRNESTGGTGGNFPHELIAENLGLDDVKIRFFARSDDTDLSVSSIRVTGWKRAEDTVTVMYTPGS